MFVEIDKEYLQSIATDSDRIPTLYYSKYLFVRKFFWFRLRLIFRSMKLDRVIDKDKSCLDFGGGGGVFLPTLSKSFDSVTCVDLETNEASQVIGHYGISNVNLRVSDIAKLEDIGEFDVVVAADVLEHFKDLSHPIIAIKKWLKKDGLLYTSLPTENNMYILLRRIFNIEKPYDHYHTAAQVEKFLSQNGFVRIRRTCVPLYIPLFPLFSISTWKRREGYE